MKQETDSKKKQVQKAENIVRFSSATLFFMFAGLCILIMIIFFPLQAFISIVLPDTFSISMRLLAIAVVVFTSSGISFIANNQLIKTITWSFTLVLVLLILFYFDVFIKDLTIYLLTFNEFSN